MNENRAQNADFHSAFTEETTCAAAHHQMNENSNELHELTRKLVKIRVNSLLFTQETEKVDGRLYEVPLVQGSACQQKSDEQESSYCHECHTYERTVRP